MNSNGGKNTNIESVIFGGGCFWCVEAVFQLLKGVLSVTSGYAGGAMPRPNYSDVSTGISGHAEVIKIEFDASIIRLEDLLAVFFTSHDPTTLNRQGNDTGTQYRSAIFYNSEEQKVAIEKYIKKLEDEKTFPSPIVTEISPVKDFYPAEKYHQNYYQNNRQQPYCQIMIDPKVVKLRKQYAYLLKS